MLTGLRNALFTLLSLYVAFPFWHNAMCPSTQTEIARIYTCQQKGKMMMNWAAQFIMTCQNCDMAKSKIQTKAAHFFQLKVTFVTNSVMMKCCSAAEMP